MTKKVNDVEDLKKIREIYDPHSQLEQVPAEKQKNKGGRPTIYTQELADRICELTSTHSFGVKKLCSIYPDLPNPDTIHSWRWKHKEFSDAYTRAKIKQAELLAEEIIDISDELIDCDDVKVGRLEIEQRKQMIDARKFLAVKLARKTYGDRIHIETDNDEEAQREILELREKLDKKHKKDY